MSATLKSLTEQLELAEALRQGKGTMLEPQDLPGRYGRVIKALDHLLQVVGCEAVVGGGWAVWSHGYIGRVTQDVDIVLGSSQLDQFLRAASVAGFDVLQTVPGRWPKMVHKETGITVDILPEGQRPGTPLHPAPTTLPNPSTVGAKGTSLRYITLPALIELKLAAGRDRDTSDVVELIRANRNHIKEIQEHLAGVHKDYTAAFDRLIKQAQEQDDS